MVVPSSPNFFERLGVQQDFMLDAETLRNAYFKLQQTYHPDRAGQDAAKRAQFASTSADINQAYHALNDPLLRAQHLLHLHGVEVNGENDTVKPGQSLLIEIMEWREAIDAADETTLQEISQRLQREEETAITTLTRAFASQAWQQAAEHTLRWQYLRKTQQDIESRKKRLANQPHVA